MVAVGLHETPFEIFDEDDNRVEHKSRSSSSSPSLEPSFAMLTSFSRLSFAADPLLLPLQERSSLELLSFETGEVIDG